MVTFKPRVRPEPRVYRMSTDAFLRQMAVAAEMERRHVELDRREDECWRMFGIQVEYFHDERIVTL